MVRSTGRSGGGRVNAREKVRNPRSNNDVFMAVSSSCPSTVAGAGLLLGVEAFCLVS